MDVYWGGGTAGTCSGGGSVCVCTITGADLGETDGTVTWRGGSLL